MSEEAAFLGRYPPFDGASADELKRLAEAARVVECEPGDVVMFEDGPVATELFVVRSGAIDLIHEGQTVEVLGPGEAFGHPSFLTGRAPAFTCQARERSSLIAIPAPLAIPHLTSEYVARTLRDRMVRVGHVVHAQGDVRTSRLGDLVHRPVALCRPDDSVREAARRMADLDVSCILVENNGGYGVLTDSDLRRKVVADGLGYDTPVSSLMVPDALTVPADRLAIDAMIDMLDAGIHHLPVVDAGGRPIGVITATDLMYLESRTPFALRRAISKAASVDEVLEAASHIPATMVAVVRAGVSSIDACRVLSLVGDTTTSRLIELAFLQHGEPPCAWSWMALGSVARRELTLASDQDNAFAYADPGGDEVDAFFKAVAADVNDGLERCGFGADNAEVMARNRQWRMSQSEWARVFADCLEQPDRSHLVRAAVAFDFRHVEGGLDIVRPLTAIERQAPDHPDFVRRIARTATDWATPLNRRRRIATAGDGTIDLKRQAMIPIVNLARFHAIAAGITISSTLERLVAAEAAGGLSADEATELREAFELIIGLRIEHQVACIEARRPPDDRLDVGALSSLSRTQLEHTLRAVAEAQKRLSRYVPIGM